jgi:hypothetical protein
MDEADGWTRAKPTRLAFLFFLKTVVSWVPVAHAYNPSYLGS